MKYPPYKYSPTLYNIQDNQLYTIGKYLAAFGHLKSEYIGDEYNFHYYEAVKSLQRSLGQTADGVLTVAMITTLEKTYEAKQAELEKENEEEESYRDPDAVFIEDSFFSQNKEALLRGAGYSIIIAIGDDNQHVKTITDVRMRSKTLQLDASGNPIAESYEFIAKDLKENTELTDN